jgi:asparagine N-glycosylation enzyme membrane subunit Stt3
MAKLRDLLGELLMPALLFGTALGFRALPLPTVVTRNAGIQPFGDNAFYHLRRIQYAAVNPADFLSTDRYLNFPHGGQPIWPPTLDWLLAQLVRLAGVAGDPAVMERLLVWVPPVIGASMVVALYGIARHYFNARVSFLAAALLCFLPSHTWYSQIGFVDHHVAIAFVTTLLLGSGTALLGQGQETSTPTSACLGRATLLGVAMAASLLVWPGTLLYVAIVQLAFAILVLTAATRESAIGWARTVAFAHFIACIAVAPWSAGNHWDRWSSFSPVVLSNFQPMWFAACALGFALLSELWRLKAGAETWLGRSLSALAIATTGLLVALLLLPELSEALGQGWAWLSMEESARVSVAESAPLFRAGSTRVQELLTRFVYLTPMALALVAWDRRRSLTPSLRLLFGWGIVLFLATLMQRRFVNSASVVYALFLAAALDIVFRRLVWRAAWPLPARTAAVAIFAAMVGWALWPSLASYGVDLVNLQRASRDEPLRLLEAKRIGLLKTAAAAWLRRLSPETVGFFDRALQPEYAVLAPRSDGHVIEYAGRRPVVQGDFGNNFSGANFELADRYYASDSETEAVSVLEEIGARYVVASAAEIPARIGSYGPRSMFARLSLPQDEPARSVGSDRLQSQVPVTRLAHHRLIYETPALDGTRGEARSYYKLYELVIGARVEGSAPPGTRVEARLRLSAEPKGELLFLAVAEAGASGRYALTVPYPNEPFSEGMRSADSYTLVSALGETSFRVSEAAVRGGEVVEGPSLAR